MAVYDETRLALEVAGEVESPLGAMALRLAQDIDQLPVSMVTMLPALVRELRLTLKDAIGEEEEEDQVGNALAALLAKMGKPSK